MADHLHIIPFILQAEGSYSNDPNDPGGETMRGVTYTTWQQFFGSDCHDRFLAMTQADWAVIFKKNYWDVALADQIASQRIADMVVDFIFNAGKFYPEKYIQDILIHSFGDQIAEDGDFGPATIAAVNAANEPILWTSIVAKRKWYYQQLVIIHPSDQEFLQGWLNRVDNLINFEA